MACYLPPIYIYICVCIKQEDEDEAKEVVEDAITAAQEYWAGLEKWKQFLESRMQRVMSYIASANELVALASPSSKLEITEHKKQNVFVSNLTIAPKVLRRWKRREDKRQREIDIQQKNLQSFVSLIIWLLSRSITHQCTEETRTSCTFP